MYSEQDFTGVIDADVLLSVTPPPQMPSTLEAETIHVFRFSAGAYRNFSEGVQLPPEATLPPDAGLPGLAANAGGAVLCQDVKTIFAGRNHDTELPEAACGLAIPIYDGEKLTSLTTFLF